VCSSDREGGREGGREGKEEVDGQVGIMKAARGTEREGGREEGREGGGRGSKRDVPMMKTFFFAPTPSISVKSWFITRSAAPPPSLEGREGGREGGDGGKEEGKEKCTRGHMRSWPPLEEDKESYTIHIQAALPPSLPPSLPLSLFSSFLPYPLLPPRCWAIESSSSKKRTQGAAARAFSNTWSKEEGGGRMRRREGVVCGLRARRSERRPVAELRL